MSVEAIEKELGVDPTLEDEQKFEYNPEVFSDEVLTKLEPYYDIYIERDWGRPVVEDPDAEDWKAVSGNKDPNTKDLYRARYLCEKQAHCIRALKLYQAYVFGSDFTIELAPYDEEDATEEDKKKFRRVAKQSRRIWEQFLEFNQDGWSVEEYGRRCWRDGEQFTRVFDEVFPPKVRFIDPERIAKPAKDIEETQGIVTDENDVTDVEYYQWIDLDTGELLDNIPAEEIIHTKIDADSNEKRGKTRFSSIIKTTRLYEAFIENEITHRQAQASIVMIRKVAGRKGPSRMYDNSRTSTTNYNEGPMNREKWRPGTIWTTGQDVDIEFAQPRADFSDASPLARMLLLHVCAATGFTYQMLTQDPSSGGYGSDLIQESPVLQMIKMEQAALGRNLVKLFKRLIESAIEAGKLEDVEPDSVWDDWVVGMKFYDPGTHDVLRNTQSSNLKVISNVWSRAEAQRRDGVDPEKMRREIAEEREQDLLDMAFAQNHSNPDVDNMKQSSAQNGKSAGTNQGDNSTNPDHKDQLG